MLGTNPDFSPNLEGKDTEFPNLNLTWNVLYAFRSELGEDCSKCLAGISYLSVLCITDGQREMQGNWEKLSQTWVKHTGQTLGSSQAEEPEGSTGMPVLSPWKSLELYVALLVVLPPSNASQVLFGNRSAGVCVECKRRLIDWLWEPVPAIVVAWG